MIANFEYFFDEGDEDITFVIENNDSQRKGYIDLCFSLDNKYFGDDE
jgi:hypothetical protein